MGATRVPLAPGGAGCGRPHGSVRHGQGRGGADGREGLGTRCLRLKERRSLWGFAERGGWNGTEWDEGGKLGRNDSERIDRR